MRKITILLSVILMLMLFLFVMGSGSFLKKPLTKNDDVIGQIHKLENAIENEDWRMANLQFVGFYRSWEKVKNRVQFSVERDSLEAIDEELGELKGTIVVKDKKKARILLEKIKNLWSEMF